VVDIEIHDAEVANLTIDRWVHARGESCCVVGRNGAGKQWIDQILLGQMTLPPGSIVPAERAYLVSFEAQQAVFEEELYNDDSDLTDDFDSGRRGIDFLPEECAEDTLIAQLNMTEVLHRPYREMSTGESRKILILSAFFSGYEVLICDNPFDSLDVESCRSLSEALHHIQQQGVSLILLVSNHQDIPNWVNRLAVIDAGRFEELGKPTDPESQRRVAALLKSEQIQEQDWPELPTRGRLRSELLVDIKGARVSYQGHTVLGPIDFQVAGGQHTLITGENGSGKSTLLGLITGDCPQCFSNDVTVMGYRRGLGESVWDIKRQMGIVSADLHRRYRVSVDVITAACSGYHDSIGLYAAVSEFEVVKAQRWLNLMGLADRARDRFGSLSYGEQRLVLIARALVKYPPLLILDEPTQGLDEPNRRRLLAVLDRIATLGYATIILVSHRSDEEADFFSQRVRLVKPPRTS